MHLFSVKNSFAAVAFISNSPGGRQRSETMLVWGQRVWGKSGSCITIRPSLTKAVRHKRIPSHTGGMSAWPCGRKPAVCMALPSGASMLSVRRGSIKRSASPAPALSSRRDFRPFRSRKILCTPKQGSLCSTVAGTYFIITKPVPRNAAWSCAEQALPGKSDNGKRKSRSR